MKHDESFCVTKVMESLSDLAELENPKAAVERERLSIIFSFQYKLNCLIFYIPSAFFVNMAGFTKDACVSLLLGQVWYEQLTDKSKLYLKQLNKEIVQGVSKYNIQ